jgi:Na+-translocating ferredoxin:NAD+ oxidoreductase RnfC subunit
MMAACSGCGFCTDYCPSHLLGYNLSPHQIVRQICYGLDTGDLRAAFFCTECGLCEYFACPMGLSPRALIAELKKRLEERGLKPPDLKPSTVEPSALREGRRIPDSRILRHLQLEEYAGPGFRYRENGNPDRIELLLDQQNGGSANPVVHVGQMVTEGMAVAEGIHSGISGRVEIIDRDRIIIVG